MKLSYLSEATLRRKLARLGLHSDIIEKAFQQAYQSHAGQKRDDGSDYLTQHIYPVVDNIIKYCMIEKRILTEELVIGALLHDVLEDDPFLLKHKFKKIFGRKIYRIVAALTKKRSKDRARQGLLTAAYLAGLKKAPEESKIIKLADRLNNISCIHASPDREKQIRYISETRDFYVPFSKKISGYFFVEIKKKVEWQEALFNH